MLRGGISHSYVCDLDPAAFVVLYGRAVTYWLLPNLAPKRANIKNLSDEATFFFHFTYEKISKLGNQISHNTIIASRMKILTEDLGGTVSCGERPLHRAQSLKSLASTPRGPPCACSSPNKSKVFIYTACLPPKTCCPLICAPSPPKSLAILTRRNQFQN